MPRFVGLAWCESCHAYHSDSGATGAAEPVSSRTRSRRAINRLGLPTSDPPSAVPVLKTSDADDFDDSEDSDYDPETDSDASSVESGNYEDEPITEEEVDRLHLPLDAWERLDLEGHVPLEVVRTQFPETRPQTHSAPPPEPVCPDCGKPVHEDDWLDPFGPDFEALEMSGKYCGDCLRLKPDFHLRAGFCNCRCTFPDEADSLSGRDGNLSSSEEDSRDPDKDTNISDEDVSGPDEESYNSDGDYYTPLVYCLGDMNSDTSSDEEDRDPHSALR
jgi:hypothetical protein